MCKGPEAIRRVGVSRLPPGGRGERRRVQPGPAWPPGARSSHTLWSGGSSRGRADGCAAENNREIPDPPFPLTTQAIIKQYPQFLVLLIASGIYRPEYAVSRFASIKYACPSHTRRAQSTSCLSHCQQAFFGLLRVLGFGLEFRAASNGAGKNALWGGYLGYIGLGFCFVLSMEVSIGLINSEQEP